MVCPACLIALAGTDGIGAVDAGSLPGYAMPLGIAIVGAGLGAMMAKGDRAGGALVGLVSGGAIAAGLVLFQKMQAAQQIAMVPTPSSAPTAEALATANDWAKYQEVLRAATAPAPTAPVQPTPEVTQQPLKLTYVI